MSKKLSRKSESSRSSILKPAKPRNPLCDVDLNPPVPIETTIMKNRRVSFANNNLIKEFTTDPEKNTIWHVSYEEANRSDQSTNSVPQILNAPSESSDLDDFNCTKIGDFDISADTSLSNTSNIVVIEKPPVIHKDTNIRKTDQYIYDNMSISHINTNPTIHLNQTSEGDLDISKEGVHPGIECHLNPNMNTMGAFHLEELNNPEPKRQTIYFNNNSSLGEMEVTETISGFVTSTDNSTANLKSYFPRLQNRDVEVTKTIHGFVNLVNRYNHNTARQTPLVNQESDLADLQKPHIENNQKSSRRTIHFNQESNAADLEMTQSIPTHINVAEQIPKTKRQTILFNQESDAADLEMTQSIPTHVNVAGCIPKTKRQTIHFNQESNDGNLEMTQSIPTHINVAGHIPKTKRQTILFNQESDAADLEMTQAIPTHINVAGHILKTKRQTIHFNQESNDGNLEMTQSIPTHINIAEQIPRTKRQTILFNQESDAADLEMTRSIPTHVNVAGCIPKTKRQTIHFNQESNDGNLEMTQSIPTHINIAGHIPKSKRQTIHFNQESDAADLDITQSIPTHVNVAGCIPRTKRQTIHFNQESNEGNLEITQSIPTHINIAGQIPKTIRQTILFNQELDSADLEMTQAIPTYINEAGHIPKTKRQTIHFNQESNDANLDMTQSIPTYVNVAGCIPKTKRQTIHFNQESNDENLEITLAIPTHIIAAGHIPKSKRQTIHFNQESNNADLDMTQSIPTHVNVAGCIPTSKRQTIHFNQESNDGNLEMTQSIPTHINVAGHIPKSKRQTIHFNQESNDGNLEMTQSIPTHINVAGHIPKTKRQTILFNQESDAADLDMTSNNGDLEMLNEETSPNIKQHTIFYNNVSNMGDMEFTQAISMNSNKISNDYQPNNKRHTIFYNSESNMGDMEMTESIPLHSNLQENIANYSVMLDKEYNPSTKRQTILFNQKSNMADMNITQSIPTYVQDTIPNYSNDENKENYPISNRRTLLLNQELNIGDKEITQLIPTYANTPGNVPVYSNMINNENHSSTKRQTILFNQESHMGDMDMTQSNPTYGNVQENIPNSSTKRQTNQFNQESNNGDMDLTETKQDYLGTNEIKRGRKESVLEIMKNRILAGNEEEATDRLNRLSMNYNQHLNYELNTPNIRNESNETISNSKTSDVSTMIDAVFSEPPVTSTQIENLSTGIDYHLKDATGLVQNNLTDSNICQRIRFPGDSFDISKIQIENLNLTPAPSNLSNRALNTFDSSKNLSKYIDSTEKLINYQIGNPMSISGVVNFPSLLSNSTSREDTNYASNAPNKIECNYELDGSFNINKKDSFIMVNSSSESDSCYEIQLKVDDLTDGADSFKALVQRSYNHFEALSPESISLVDSFNSNNSNTNFAAINFHAKEIERHLNQTVIDDNPQSNTEDITEKLERFKKMLNDLTVLEDNYIVTNPVEEKAAIIESVNGDILRERFNKMKEKHLLRNKISAVAPKEFTLEEQIKEKSKDTMWSIICLDNEEFQFSFMYDTITFVVDIDRISEIVKSVAVFSQFCELTSHPQALFVHRILKNKLSQSHIKSACGQTYNMLSFLDYITILGEQMLDIFNEFDSLQVQYGLVIDRELNATYTATNSYLRTAFEVTFNLNNLDNISEECLSINVFVGSVRQATVKSLVKGCPQGIAFIRTFITHVEEYLRILKNAKQSRH